MDALKYLVTADIHGNPVWYDWLLSQSPNFDAILIAGDLIDFHDEGLAEREKVSVFLNFASQMEASECKLLFTSGNHDLDDLELLDGSFASDLKVADMRWMEFPFLNKLRSVSGYLQVREFDDFVALPIPWFPWTGASDLEEESVRFICAEARELASKTRKPFALISHEKPESSYFLESLVSQFSPDLYLCGHEHTQPLHDGPIRKHGQTTVINVGQGLEADIPFFGVLNTRGGYLDWHLDPDRVERFTIELPRQGHY